MAGLSAEEPVGQCEEIDRIHEMVDEILHAPQPLASNELHRAAVLMEIFSILIREKEKNEGTGLRFGGGTGFCPDGDQIYFPEL